MKVNQRFTRSFIATTVVGAGLMTAAIPGARADGIAPIPLNANAYGNTYGEWSAMWWQWLLSIPTSTNPNNDDGGANCAQKQPAGPVWFLAGTFSSTPNGSLKRTCTVPTGKALFFPIVNGIFGAVGGDCQPSNPGVVCNLADLRKADADALDAVATLKASVDGQPLTNTQGNNLDLKQQRVQSPVLTITLPADNVYGFTGTKYPPDGTYATNVSDGYWLLLPPLSPGHHTIYFKGTFPNVDPFNGFTVEVTYSLTVK